MADISCVLWNCSGILSASSAKEKIDFPFTSTNFNFDVLVLVETHHKDIHDIHPSFHTYRNSYHLIHTEAGEDDPCAGIIVLVNKSLTVSGELVVMPGRLLNFKVGNHEGEYNISAVYGFTGNSATQLRMKEMVDRLSQVHTPAGRNIVLGDFNFVENDLDRVNESRTGKNPKDISLSAPWVNFAGEIDLSDPFRVKNPKRRMFSYIHTQNRAKSRIDRVYVNDEECQNIVHYKHTVTPFTMAHRMVSFTVKEDAVRGPGYWKMNSSVITDRPYKIIIEKTIEEVLELPGRPGCD